LDYLWARLPVLVSEGDVTSEWISQYGVGQVVPPLDVEALAQALTEMLDKPKSSWASAYEPFRDSFRWSQVVEPLRRYCWQGEQAPDRHLRNLSVTLPTVALRRGRVARAIEIWRTDGLQVLLFRLRQKLQQKLVRL
jgi:hypothetical protein